MVPSLRVAVLAVAIVSPVAAVEPASVTATNYRGQAQSPISEQTFFQGSTLLFTNMVSYSGTSTNSSLENLTNVTVEIRIGSSEVNTAYTGTVYGASSMYWWKSITVPTNLNSALMQLKLVDGSGNTYIYPHRTIISIPALD
jgi:hypothetical protein